MITFVQGLVRAANMILILAVVVILSQVTRAEFLNHPSYGIHRGLNEDSLRCTIYEIASLVTRGRKLHIPNRLSCTSTGHGPTVILEGGNGTFFREGYHSGFTTLNIPSRLISANFTVDLDNQIVSDLVTIVPDTRTRIEKRYFNGSELNKKSIEPDFEGIFRTLVVRVSDIKGNAPSYSAIEISDQVFDNYLSMAKQYRACSDGKLKFTKAVGGSRVMNGVVDVVVNIDLATAYDSIVCVNAADDALSELDIGDSHVYTMYICPDVVNFGMAAAVGSLGGVKSWYSDKAGSSPFVQMHELGHNLLFFHSSEGNQVYGDPTCIMGGSYIERPSWGRMCFNAAKTFSTGWYSDHHEIMNTTERSDEASIINLVDINSAVNGVITSDDRVVVKIVGNGRDALYFMLHRLKGITSHMVSDKIETHANRVNIVKQAAVQGRRSNAISHLAKGDEYIADNWSGTGKSLYIKVCSIAENPDDSGAKVLVYFGNRKRYPRCYEYTNDSQLIVPTRPPEAPSLELTNEGTCQDSPLKMFFSDGTRRGCDWVNDDVRQTQDRCNEPGVASHCPLSCGTCVLCVDSGKRFEADHNIRSCSWVKKKFSQRRCRISGVAETCKATCEKCFTG